MDNVTRTIFVVDDNKSNLVTALDALSSHYTVLTFDSGARMLSVMEKKMPDLILLDVQMPDMNGYQVMVRLKANHRFKKVPVIFLTAMDSVIDEVKGLEMGALDYIIKPFSAVLLRKRVELHLKLFDYSNNLERMVQDKIQEITKKTNHVESLKNSLLRTTAELVEYRDETTGNHIERTQEYLELFINAMKVYDVYADEARSFDMELVLQSSQLHDVGKISVRDAILFKPDRLTPEEYEEMKLHATMGEKIINKMKATTHESDFLEYARIFAVAHHERWDGSGYPAGLQGEAIPLLGRIMAIADVYDALVTKRPYKEAYPHDQAVQVIYEGRGTHFDPALIDLFMQIHTEFNNISNHLKELES